MKELKERLEIEKQQWIENYMKKQVKYTKPSKLPWFESELPDKDEKYLAFESSTNVPMKSRSFRGSSDTNHGSLLLPTLDPHV